MVSPDSKQLSSRFAQSSNLTKTLPQSPNIELPKGGGAIRGIGEKFTANPVTGTGSMSIPIATSPGRGGFGPELSLSYDSGAGNGSFGFGWQLSLPSISRKTDKGLPRYRDQEESDTFLLAGAEDLVPIYEDDPQGRAFLQEQDIGEYRIRSYRPRVEGLFAKIERWTHLHTGEIYWRTISPDNVLTVYGDTPKSRVSAKKNGTERTFEWLICASYDDKGNAILYEYAEENKEGVNLAALSEQNRERTANRYVKRIRYGNHKPRANDRVSQGPLTPKLSSEKWLFDVVFDYGEPLLHPCKLDNQVPEDQQHRYVIARNSLTQEERNDKIYRWSTRPDPFSHYRAGFEIRAHRRCQRVLMFHQFKELGEEACLVKSTEFDYRDFQGAPNDSVQEQRTHQGSTQFASFIVAASHSGYVRSKTSLEDYQGAKYVKYLKQSIPPIEFEYSKASIQRDVRTLDPDSSENLPVGIDGDQFRLVDLNGEGLSGCLIRQSNAYYYKENLGDGNLGPLKPLSTQPSAVLSRASNERLMDLEQDGQLDLTVLDGPAQGFYSRNEDEQWDVFRNFRSLPNIAWNDPNLQFIDLSGDGLADILLTECDAFTWYKSLGKQGFDQAQSAVAALDESKGPRLANSDPSQPIFLADMTGDGLTDIVRIRKGFVCYWPNLGYGQFGAQVIMERAPHFDHSDQFDPQRIKLADIDGSGTIDILYIGRSGVTVFFNAAGNRWSQGILIDNLPLGDALSNIEVNDLLGDGTACLVWSSALPSSNSPKLKYLHILDKKPHLLVKMINNMGAETLLHYVSSTKFYLEDKQRGKPWRTKLPFPVHVVERVDTIDHISRNHFTTRYKYHHGYYDRHEREFRGFGMVEQFDSEDITALKLGANSFVTNQDKAHLLPTVLTKTWYHTGNIAHEKALGPHYIDEYFSASDLTDPQTRQIFIEEKLLPDTVLPQGLRADDAREAVRALKGQMLRQEVYALDDSPKQGIPYTTAEQNFTVKCLQKKWENRHGVFLVHPRETLNYQLERKPHDPRIAHSMTLHVDNYGNVTRAVNIAYGRSSVPSESKFGVDLSEQLITHIIYNEFNFTNAVNPTQIATTHYRTPQPCETKTYEITGLAPRNIGQRFQYKNFADSNIGHLASLDEIEYEETANPIRAHKRLIEHTQVRYRPDDMGVSENNILHLLPLGELESKAIAGEGYTLAFTQEIIDNNYKRNDDQGYSQSLIPLNQQNQVFAEEGGYVKHKSAWWIPSGRQFFSSKNNATPQEELEAANRSFYSPKRSRDPFYRANRNTESYIEYDIYTLLPTKSQDPLGNTAISNIDYRVLQANKVVDINHNTSLVAFDALGMVVATAAQGKVAPNGDCETGDTLDTTPLNLTQHELETFYQHNNPQALTADYLGKATSRIIVDTHRYYRSKEQGAHPNYNADLARETHVKPTPQGQSSKIQLAFSYSNGLGKEIQQKIQAEPGPVKDLGTNVSSRWVGSGWTVLNNKGLPVRQFEPFFSQLNQKRHQFEFNVRAGVSPVIFYDPLGRAVATLHPNNTYEKVVFDNWHQTNYDTNDTCAPKIDSDATKSQTGDPRSDPDIRHYVDKYVKQLEKDHPNWQAWYQQRIAGTLGKREQAAAIQAASHANTPSIQHLDSIGRPFISIEINRVACEKHPLHGHESMFITRTVLDIEGNEQQVIDAKGRIVMNYAYNMAGPEEEEEGEEGEGEETAVNRIKQESMEAGQRWVLIDIAGNPIRSWDNRGHTFTHHYDVLRRPTIALVIGESPKQSDPHTRSLLSNHSLGIAYQCMEYGEAQNDSTEKNLNGQAFKHYDASGLMVNHQLDYQGNVVRQSKQFTKNIKQPPNWQTINTSQLSDEVFTTQSRFDALGRVTQSVFPRSDRRIDNKERKYRLEQRTYNEANLLESVNVWLDKTTLPIQLINAVQDKPDIVVIKNIDYDAKGQRQRIDYGNGTSTTYTYDEEIYQLRRLFTERNQTTNQSQTKLKENSLQDLSYVYDAVGNITSIRDDAHQAHFFNNAKIEPHTEYCYDSTYRLIQAEGRAQYRTNPIDNIPSHKQPEIPKTPIDGNAMQRYRELYVYDEVGNFLSTIHKDLRAQNPTGWTREYFYHEPSLMDDDARKGFVSNRLSATKVNNITENYAYDTHGSMQQMCHLSVMQWDYLDQLEMSKRQSCGNEIVDSNSTYYQYDSEGDRARKGTLNTSGQLAKERFYLGGYEIYREYSVQNVALERETLHIMDDEDRVLLIELKTQGQDASNKKYIRFQYGNHLGSASLEINEGGSVVSYEEYFPYGSTAYSFEKHSEVPKRYKYTGMERDEETGFSYHGARYYCNLINTWISCDPSGLKGGLHSYQYSSLNPIYFIDKGGMAPRKASPYARFREFFEEGFRRANEDGLPFGMQQLNYLVYGAALIILPKSNEEIFMTVVSFGAAAPVIRFGGALFRAYSKARKAMRWLSKNVLVRKVSKKLEKSKCIGQKKTGKKVNNNAAPEIESLQESISRETSKAHPEWYRRKRQSTPLPNRTNTQEPLKSLGYDGPRSGYYSRAKPNIASLQEQLNGLNFYEAHHFWPMYLNGIKKQTLLKIPRYLHKGLHTDMMRWKGGIFNYNANPRRYVNMPIQKIFDELLDFYRNASGGLYSWYVPNLLKAAKETFSSIAKK